MASTAATQQQQQAAATTSTSTAEHDDVARVSTPQPPQSSPSGLNDNVQLITRQEWEDQWQSVQSIAAQLQQRHSMHAEPAMNIMRVSQLDAEQLDLEISSILTHQFSKAFAFFNVGWVSSAQPELQAAVRLLIWYYSVWPEGTSYGRQLQNLTYRNEFVHQYYDKQPSRPPVFSIAHVGPSNMQRVLWAFFHIGGAWAWARLNKYSTANNWGGYPQGDWRRSLWHWMDHIETGYKVMAFFHLLLFLYNGKYMSLIDRMLGMRMVYKYRSLPRQVSFEYMNRNLVWTGLTEFLMFMVPLVSLDKVKAFIQRHISKRIFHPNQRDSAARALSCSECNASPPNVAFEANCTHLFCYYCVKSNLLADAGYCCPQCGQQVKAIKRKRFDV